MPIGVNRRGQFSGGSTFNTLQRMLNLQQFEDEEDRLASSANSEMINSVLGAVPVVGPFLGGISRAVQSFGGENSPSKNIGFAAPGSASVVGGGGGGPGAALADVQAVAAERSLRSAQRDAASKLKIAKGISAAGNVVNTVISLGALTGPQAALSLGAMAGSEGAGILTPGTTPSGVTPTPIQAQGAAAVAPPIGAGAGGFAGGVLGASLGQPGLGTYLGSRAGQELADRFGQSAIAGAGQNQLKLAAQDALRRKQQERSFFDFFNRRR